MRYKKITALLVSLILSVSAMAGCGTQNQETPSVKFDAPEAASGSEAIPASEAASGSETVSQAGEFFSDRDLAGTYDADEAVSITLSGDSVSCSSDNATIDGSSVTITGEGVYLLNGTFDDGQIIVDADSQDKVQLVLNGVSIQCMDSAAIYVKQADKVFVTLADGTENSLSTTGAFVQIDDNTVDGAIFSKDDLTINGSGSLAIATENGHGIVSKDELVITGGSLAVTASGHALSGKDCVCIAGGAFALTAGKDGIHSENNDDTEKGYIYIADGTFSIDAAVDGLDASNDIQIDGGAISISAGDDGMHTDCSLLIENGTIDIRNSYEGLEGMTITIDGGEISITARDDGLNAAGGKDGSGMNGPMGGMDQFASQDGVCLTIRGGLLTVNADGDGLDSNGDLIITGGTIYVFGPQDSANGALDHNGSSLISGGTLVAVSCSSMEETFDENSFQGTIAVSLTDTVTGELTLTDRAGNVLASCTTGKKYNVVQISCPELSEGETYTLTTNAGATAITMDSLHYSTLRNAGGMRMDGNGPGRGQDQFAPGKGAGNLPDGQFPDGQFPERNPDIFR